MILLYNLVMAAVDLAVLDVVRRRKSLPICFAALATAGVLALFLAGLFGGRDTDGLDVDHLRIFLLAACGIFVHAPLVLLVSGVLCWPRSRLLSVGAGLLAAGILLVAFEAFLVEPTWLEVSQVQIISDKVTRPLKIAVLADLQTDRITDYEPAVLRRVMEEKPDLILLAGDYLQAPRGQESALRKQLNVLLHEIRLAAPAGVFAVRGNVDPEDWQEMFADLGITTVDATQTFELDQLRLTCLSLIDSYDMSAKVVDPDRRRFHLVLGHTPNFAWGSIAADLLVAGHTHGGQVRLPWIGPLLTHAHVPARWAAGLSELPSGAKLLVSRGIGMNRNRYAPRMRLLCRPELVLIELVPSGEHVEDQDSSRPLPEKGEN